MTAAPWIFLPPAALEEILDHAVGESADLAEERVVMAEAQDLPRRLRGGALSAMGPGGFPERRESRLPVGLAPLDSRRHPQNICGSDQHMVRSPVLRILAR
jgi:hypothetical protein